MLNQLLDPGVFPFSVALGLLFGLLTLEVITALLGGSLLGMQADSDADFELDLDAVDGVDAIDSLDTIETSIDLADFDMPDFNSAEFETAELNTAPTTDATPAGTDWLGIKQVPTLIWIAALLLGFGLSGVSLQTVLLGALGFALPASLAVVPCAGVALWFAKTFSKGFARILPKNESSALSENHLGRRRGVVSQGVAKRGKPAEIRVIDGHGNTHYLRAEPLRDDDEITQGTPVIVMRKSYDEGYRIVALSA